eukprot:scaffold2482_cov166-Amphora_coffeaeformis.AAC.5
MTSPTRTWHCFSCFLSLERHGENKSEEIRCHEKTMPLSQSSNSNLTLFSTMLPARCTSLITARVSIPKSFVGYKTMVDLQGTHLNGKANHPGFSSHPSRMISVVARTLGTEACVSKGFACHKKSRPHDPKVFNLHGERSGTQQFPPYQPEYKSDL